ncbi:MAG TPA: hypothetical protein VLT62_18495 [Candidatus Methylomirabilis sp.]|nr:hypothetical protein [Candidatus Methylomirabilis sp.]
MASKTRSAGSTPKRNIVPDRLDLRDRPYLPSVAVAARAARPHGRRHLRPGR